MIQNKTITLVIPCRNEAQALAQTLGSVPAGIDEIIIVDNGSTDNTVLVAKQFGAKVLREEKQVNGIGYGYAHAKGIREAEGEIIVCLDGDGSYPIEKIPTIVAHLEKKNIDFISCNRLPFQQPKKMSSVRKLGVVILNYSVRLLFGYPLQDSLTGMWVFRRNIRSDLTLFEGGWNFSLEIKLHAMRNKKIRFSEYHIPYHDRQFDASKQKLYRTGFEHFLFLLNMRFFVKKYDLSLNNNKNLLFSPSRSYRL